MLIRSFNLFRRSYLTSSRMLANCNAAPKMPKSLAKLRKLQAAYQCEDGRPIWLKAGFRDWVLYFSTIIGCYVGVLMVLATIYDHAKPASWKTNAC